MPPTFVPHSAHPVSTFITGGNTTGTVRMWDVDSAHFMHALEHGGVFAVYVFTATLISLFRSKQNLIC
jgi:hypothetical protein